MNAFWSDRPTLVTGATGLVGGWLVPRLVAAGADVVCLVRDWVPDSEFVRSGHDRPDPRRPRRRCDQACLSASSASTKSTVIHLAAQTIVAIANRNPISTFETNIAGTWRLLEACRRDRRVEQIVLASSDKAYGDPRAAVQRDAPLQGRHPYDVSKSCADLIAQTYADTYGLPVVITRCGNFYGGGDLNWNRIVPGTIRSVLRGQRPVVRSDGQFIRDYFYVEDGAAAYMLLAETTGERPGARGQAFNFSNEVQVTVLELVNRILRAHGLDLDRRSRTRRCDEIRHHTSARRRRELLAGRRLFTLDEGLERTIDWYRDFLSPDA